MRNVFLCAKKHTNEQCSSDNVKVLIVWCHPGPPTHNRWSSVCRNLRKWAAAVSSTREKSEETFKLFQRAVSSHGMNLQHHLESCGSLSDSCAVTLSGTLSSRVAASGKIKIDPLWRRWAARSIQQRRTPPTKSSRCRGPSTSRSTCRRPDTGIATATRFSDQISARQLNK